MNWRTISPQLVLALVFGIIAVAVAAAIVARTFTALGAADHTIGYSTTELQGIRYISRTQDALDRLIMYRNASAAKRSCLSASVPGGAAVARITAAIARLPDRSPNASLDALVSQELLSVQQRWRRPSLHARFPLADLEATVVAVQALMVALQTRSGIADDLSIDGVNFGDALVRFPASLDDGDAAATTALCHVASADAALPPRFSAAQLLARAQIALNVGLQDAKDETLVNPVAAAALVRTSAAHEAAFKAIREHITLRYIDGLARGASKDRVLAHEAAVFSASGVAAIDVVRQSLLRVVVERIDRTRTQQRQTIVDAVVTLCLEALVLFALARICLGSYRNAGKRIAERALLDVQRAELESELANAHAQQAVLRAKGQFHAVFDHAPTGMIIVDRECRIVEVNEAAQAMFADAVEPSAASVIADHAAIVYEIFNGTIDLHSAERHYPSHEHLRWFHISLAPVQADSGEAISAVFMVRDITEKKALEAQLQYEAGHDSLTGLLNRQAFLNVLQAALDLRVGADVFSVVFIDFNDFKAINDSFGHAAGDRFLVEGSARLRRALRSTDVVARFGGDEFAVLLYGNDRFDIEGSVLRLQSILAVPVDIEGQRVASSASFGIAQAEVQYTLASELVRDADTAMYHAKLLGGRDFVVFNQSMRETAVRRMQLSIDLTRALDNHELQLYYQPIVRISDGRLAGCEALLRWPQPSGTSISPAEFIPLAEENGSIVAIGQLVMRTACNQIHRWNELARQGTFELPADFVVHVNLAAAEVHNAELSANLNHLLEALSVDRAQLMLEITESNMLKATQQTSSTLERLTNDGFRLCIDDFGTGYSSLRYLNDLPLHSFKIDRSFVFNGGDGLANGSIVEMLMVLSRSLGLEVVAEGIETHTQWQQLRDLGCTYGQGYYFSPAVNGAAFTQMLEENSSAVLL